MISVVLDHKIRSPALVFVEYNFLSITCARWLYYRELEISVNVSVYRKFKVTTPIAIRAHLLDHFVYVAINHKT